MTRAKLHFLPDYVWHITHRCHNKDFHLKFAKDRRLWLYWLFNAKKKYRLTILDYTVTSNHIHLLVLSDEKKDVISRSIQLVASQTALGFNRRKNRSGAFWEDHYHATAVETSKHLMRCMIYINLNMVRAGVVKHPLEWPFSGYYEIFSGRQRYTLINRNILMNLLQYCDFKCLKNDYEKLVQTELENENLKRENLWTESIAVGTCKYIRKIKSELGIKSIYKSVNGKGSTYTLKQLFNPYKHHK